MRKLTKEQRTKIVAKLLNTGLRTARKKGYRNVSFEDIERSTQYDRTSMYSFFKSTKDMRNKLVCHAILNQDYQVLAQAMAVKDPVVKNMSQELKTKTSNWLAAQI